MVYRGSALPKNKVVLDVQNHKWLIKVTLILHEKISWIPYKYLTMSNTANIVILTLTLKTKM